MKNLIGLMAAMTMMGAPAFAKTPGVHRAHKPRAAHAKKARARKAHHPRKSTRKAATPPSDVVEMPAR